MVPNFEHELNGLKLDNIYKLYSLIQANSGLHDDLKDELIN